MVLQFFFITDKLWVEGIGDISNCHNSVESTRGRILGYTLVFMQLKNVSHRWTVCITIFQLWVSCELASRYTLVYLSWVNLQILVVLLHHSQYKCWSTVICVYHMRYRKRLLQSNKPFCGVSHLSKSSSFTCIKRFLPKYFKIYHLWNIKIPLFCNLHCLCVC
jgi:hypothetical protein